MYAQSHASLQNEIPNLVDPVVGSLTLVYNPLSTVCTTCDRASVHSQILHKDVESDVSFGVCWRKSLYGEQKQAEHNPS